MVVKSSRKKVYGSWKYGSDIYKEKKGYYASKHYTSRDYTGLFITMLKKKYNMIGAGLAIGVAIGVSLNNIALGIGVGVAIGAGLVTTQMKKENSSSEEEE